MSISAECVSITPDEYSQFLSQPESVEGFFFGGAEAENYAPAETIRAQERRYVIGAQWQAIHYLLTGEVSTPGRSRVPPPLCNVIMGGRQVASEDYEDLVRYLTPEEVREVSEVLEGLSPEVVRRSFQRTEHEPVSIYHQLPLAEWDEHILGFLIDIYSGLRDFYASAAVNGGAVLIWMG
jgi:hypothetical protein